MAGRQVFISYAWGGESEIVANELEAILTGNSFHLVRDKTDLGFKGLIREFMEMIGHGNLVVLVISDKYLKSKNCMFELLEVAKKGEFHSRIFPIVLEDAAIYDALGMLTYLKYWDQKIKELNAGVKELDNLADTRKIQEDINLYTDIRATIDDLAGKIGNMNTLTLEIMREKKYQPLLDALLNTITPPSGPSLPSKKEGKVLYHIPRMMQLNSWIRCTVRLAWEEILLTEGLKIPKDQVQIESIRLANVMQVALKEGRDGHNFEIKTLSNEEQFIFEDDFTEWLYDVKPLTVGNFTLILRITLVHIIEGQERKKDLVLEREVTTETLVPKALPKFETAESGLMPFHAERRDPRFTKLDDMPGSKDHHVYPELSEYIEEPTQSSQVSNPAPSPGPPQSPPLAKSSQAATRSKQKNETSIFKKALPYVASLVVLAVVGVAFFTGNNSSTTGEMTGLPPDMIGLDTLSFDKNIMVALNFDALSPDGEQVSETIFFVIDRQDLDSLKKIDLGNYTLSTLSLASDTMNLSNTQSFSIQEINDSLLSVKKRPIWVGDKMIDRKDLKIKSDN